jgi:proteasome assembly chaperone (PAC2) family protein
LISNAPWKISHILKKKVSSPILIEGLPGIGNVGKIVVDYIIEEVKAEKLMEFFSYCLPNSVFVNENNMVSLPRLELYYAKFGSQDYLFLAGDVQPATEEGSYTFTELILGILQEYGCKEIITLGGIGLAEIPEKPEVYCASNDLKFIQKFVKAGAKKKLWCSGAYNGSFRIACWACC